MTRTELYVAAVAQGLLAGGYRALVGENAFAEKIAHCVRSLNIANRLLEEPQKGDKPQAPPAASPHSWVVADICLTGKEHQFEAYLLHSVSLHYLKRLLDHCPDCGATRTREIHIATRAQCVIEGWKLPRMVERK